MLLELTPTTENVGKVLYGALAAILFLFGTDLLSRYTKADKRTRTDAAYLLFLMLALGVLGYAFYMVPGIIIDFFDSELTVYYGNYESWSWLKTFRFFLIVLILGPFAMVAENILSKKKRKIGIFAVLAIFGILYGLILTIVRFVAENPEAYAQYEYVLYGLIGIFALYGFFGLFYILLKQLSPQKEIKKKMQIGLSAGILALFGEFLQAMGRMDDIDPGYFVAGTFIEIIGWLAVRHYFLGVPSYSEFEWKSGLIELHVIMAETGISLYYKSFNTINPEDLKGDLDIHVKLAEDEHRPNSDLVAGGLIGIKGMLSEISGEKGKLENIQIGEKSLIFKQGDVIMCLLLADKNLGVYHSILGDLVAAIESSHPDLKNFNGDTRQLKIEPAVQEAFGLSKEEMQR